MLFLGPASLKSSFKRQESWGPIGGQSLSEK